MLNSIEKNNEYIEKLSALLSTKRPDVLASLNVLSNNNKALAYFLDSIDDNHAQDELILRVYGLLQILFVSIDSLYTLSLSTTRSKNFISLNDNKELRELKYIRNDVVGHPTNRVVDNHIEYSILKSEDIFKDHLSYTIYYDDTVTKREVNLVNLITIFYDESNYFLENLIRYKQALVTEGLSDDLLECFTIWMNKNDILVNLKNLKKKLSSQSREGRNLKKVNLLINLVKDYYHHYNQNLYFVIAYHLRSLYYMVSNEEGAMVKRLPLPNLTDELLKIKKLFGNRHDLRDSVYHLYDINHPLFYKSLARLTVDLKNNSFMEEINKNVRKNNRAYVYAYASVLKEIAKLSD